jgi:hypothetical protein
LRGIKDSKDAAMNNFWIGILAAQKAGAGTKPAGRRHRVLQIVAGIAIGLLIGAGLVIAEMFHG